MANHDLSNTPRLPLMDHRPLAHLDEDELLQLQSSWGMTTPYHFDEPGTGMNVAVLRVDLTVADAMRVTERRLRGLCAVLDAAADQDDERAPITRVVRTAAEDLRLALGTTGVIALALEQDRDAALAADTLPA